LFLAQFVQHSKFTGQFGKTSVPNTAQFHPNDDFSVGHHHRD
jgi:hypothetical protein